MVNGPATKEYKYYQGSMTGAANGVGMSQERQRLIREIDFRRVEDRFQYPSGVPGVSDEPEERSDRMGNINAPRDADGRLLTEKQIRARARRKARRVAAKSNIMTKREEHILHKPISEWDLQELARGRPRDKRGGFKGRVPEWVTRDFHEKAMEQFRSIIRSEMNVHTVSALDAIDYVLGNVDVDERGKPLISASTKLEAAKFLLEHTVGKPTQRIESDVSVKLQGILGQVMVNPHEINLPNGQGANQYEVGHLPGVTMPMATAGDIVDAEEVEEDE